MKKIDEMSFFKYLEESEKERLLNKKTEKVNYFDVIKQRCLESLNILKDASKFRERRIRVVDTISEDDIEKVLYDSTKIKITNIYIQKVYSDKYDDYKEQTKTVFFTEIL